MKKTLVCFLALILLAMNTNGAYAAGFVPTEVICENRDGRQLIIKTYTLLPEEDPDLLNEEPFEQEGFLYSFSSITKYEHPLDERKVQKETVTVETSSNNLSVILEALAPTIAYEDGHFSGTLALDHSSMHTEATGYTSKSYSVTETKTIEGLDRNDPSYVPNTTVKNGLTLTLSNVEWSVQGTSLSGDELVPTLFMATATYGGYSSRQVANGYVTTANYSGEVTASGIASITYTVTFLGSPVAVPEPDPPLKNGIGPVFLNLMLWGAGLLLLAAIALLLTKRNTSVYTLTDNGEQYERIGRLRLSGKNLYIDLCRLKIYPRGEAVIEIEGSAARKLFGRVIQIHLRDGDRTHLVERSGKDTYWFTVIMGQEEISE